MIFSLGKCLRVTIADYFLRLAYWLESAIYGHSVASYIGEMSIGNLFESRRSQEYGDLQKVGRSRHS